MYETFIHCLQGLQIPIGSGIIIWWFVKHDREDAAPSADDAVTEPDPAPRHPRDPSPRRPRRGPHGAAAPASPSRVRTGRARARTF